MPMRDVAVNWLFLQTDFFLTGSRTQTGTTCSASCCINRVGTNGFAKISMGLNYKN
jgi:hypothetical protein